jgi:hypothetical protein
MPTGSPKTLLLLHLRQLPIPLDLHRRWERDEAAVIWRHVLRNSSGSSESLEMALRPRSSAEVIHPADDLEHGGKSELAEPKSKALVWPKAKVCI